MLLVLPTSHLDAPAAQRLLDWIAEIKTPTEKHELIIAASKRVDISTFKSSFEKTSFFVPHDEDERGWPQSPNHLFKRLCQHITWNVRKHSCVAFWTLIQDLPMLRSWSTTTNGFPKWVFWISSPRLGFTFRSTTCWQRTLSSSGWNTGCPLWNFVIS